MQISEDVVQTVCTRVTSSNNSSLPYVFHWSLKHRWSFDLRWQTVECNGRCTVYMNLQIFFFHRWLRKIYLQSVVSTVMASSSILSAQGECFPQLNDIKSITKFERKCVAGVYSVRMRSHLLSICAQSSIFSIFFI